MTVALSASAMILFALLPMFVAVGIFVATFRLKPARRAASRQLGG